MFRNGFSTKTLGAGILCALMPMTFIIGSSLAIAADEIVIGFQSPDTGADVKESIPMKRALELAVKKVNQKGINGKKLKVITVDHKSTPPGALESFNQLVTQKVVAVVGPIKSAQIIAMLPAITTSKTPIFIGGTAVRLTQGSDRWAFRMRPDDSIVAAAMTKFIADDLKKKKIGILNDDSAFGTGGANFVAKGADDNKLGIVKRLQYKTTDRSEFKKIVADFKAAGVEVVVSYNSNAEDTGHLHRAIKEAGNPFQFVGSPSNASKLSLETAKGASEGAYVVGDMTFGQTDLIRNFSSEYKKEFGDDPDSIYSYTYDSILVLAKALETNPKDGEALRNAIFAVKGHDGILGKVAFDQLGNGIQEANVCKIKDGKPELIKAVK